MRSTFRRTAACLTAPYLTAGAMLLGAGPGGAPVASAQPVREIALWDNATGPHLRGAVVYERRRYPDIDGGVFMGDGAVGPPFQQSDFDRLADLGANLVVISHPGLFTETPPFGLDEAVQANLDRLVGMAARADLFAVISFRTGPGRSEFTFYYGEAGTWFDAGKLNDTVWADPAAQAAWAAMWRHTAERYRDAPNVVGYELMVEPNSAIVGADARDPIEIWDPDAFAGRYAGTLYDWNRLTPAIVAAIRSADPDTPVLVEGNGYGSVRFLPHVEPIADPAVVYAAHNYEPSPYTHQEPGDGRPYPGRFDVTFDGRPDAVDADLLDRILQPLDEARARGLEPVALTEFGAARWVPGAQYFLEDEITWLERRGVSHAVYEWQTSYQPFLDVVTMFGLRLGPDPASHSEVSYSPVLDILRFFWERNRARPSNVELVRSR